MLTFSREICCFYSQARITYILLVPFPAHQTTLLLWRLTLSGIYETAWHLIPGGSSLHSPPSEPHNFTLNCTFRTINSCLVSFLSVRQPWQAPVYVCVSHISNKTKEILSGSLNHLPRTKCLPRSRCTELRR